jgi:hypothetical protein
MVVGDILNIYFKLEHFVSKVWRRRRRQRPRKDEGWFGIRRTREWPQVDDCLAHAQARVSGIHHPVHIHSILDLSPLSLDSGTNIFFQELRNGSCLSISSGILFPLISAIRRQSRVSRKDSDLREFVRVTGASYAPLFSPLINHCI